MTYGKGGILDEDAKDILIQTAFKHDCEGSEIFFTELQIADIAWYLALMKAGVFKEKELLDVLVNLREFEINPQYGDIYNSKNIALKKLSPLAKNIHFSRPRREAINIAFYIKLRSILKEFFDEAKNLANVFIKKALKEKDKIVSDYTYLQQAQPTTFGHYMLTFLFPLIRDLERLELLDKHLSYSPAGSGSVNGCSVEIDRFYLAALLGFENVEFHARDSMWRSDIVIEAIVRVESILANLNRFVEELIIFATSEFNLIKLPSSLSRASVIMPNKQNPYALTYFRGLVNEILGKVVSYFSYEKIVSGHPDSRTFVYVDLINTIEKSKKALKLLEVVISEMVVNQKEFDDFFFATEIAEELVKKENLTYEEAHTKVGKAVKEAKEKNLKLQDVLGVELDVKKSIQKKKTIGGVGDLENIIQKAKEKLNYLHFNKNNFSFLNQELKRMGYDIEFT